MQARSLIPRLQAHCPLRAVVPREEATPLSQHILFVIQTSPPLRTSITWVVPSSCPLRGNGGFSFSSLRNAAAPFRRAAAFRRFAHSPNLM
jgi:hypothetical protein